MSKLINITGSVFGRLTVMSGESRVYANRRQVMWLCRCECGNTIQTTGTHLRAGRVKSCGCLNVEETASRSRTHGLGKPSSYTAWTAMRSRCYNPNDAGFSNYGGRGIRVCERWRSFENFFSDMGDRPPGSSIDRIDNDGDYRPENCRWADRVTQNGNRRNCITLTHGGKTQPLLEWSRQLGITPEVLRRRVSLGWSHSKILSTPVRGAGRAD